MAAAGHSEQVAGDQAPIERRPSAPRRRSKVEPVLADKPRFDNIWDISGSITEKVSLPGPLLPAETGIRVRFTSNERDTDSDTGRPFTLYTAEIQTPLTSWTKDCRFKQLSDVQRSLQQTLGRAAPTFPRKPGLFGANLQSEFISQRQKELNDWISKVFYIPACLNDQKLIALFESERGDMAVHIALTRSRATTAALQQQLQQSEAHSSKLAAQLESVHTTLFQFRLRLARLEAAVGTAAGADTMPALELSTTMQASAQGAQTVSHGFKIREASKVPSRRASPFKSFASAAQASSPNMHGEEEDTTHKRSYTFPAPFRATDFGSSFVVDDPLRGCSPGVAWLLGGPDARPPARSVKALNLPGPTDATDFVQFAQAASQASNPSHHSHQIVLDSSSGVRVNMAAQGPVGGAPAAQPHACIEWANTSIENMITAVSPSCTQVQARQDVVSFVQQLVQFGLGLECLPVGSAAAGSDLIDSDVDLTFVCGPSVDLRSALDAISASLSSLAQGVPLNQAVQQLRSCHVELRPPTGDQSKQQMEASDSLVPKWALSSSSQASAAAASARAAPGGFRPVFAGCPDAAGHQTKCHAAPTGAVQLSKVSLVVASTPLVKLVANGVAVDLSANSLHSLAAVLLVRLADEWIGNDKLFTRSLRFIKAILLYQVPYLLPGLHQSICSAEHGTFNSWTITVMLLALFNSHPIPIRSPLSALLLFMEEYHSFSFGTHVITLHGPLHLFNLTRSRPTVQPRFVTDARLFPLRQLAARRLSSDKHPLAFSIGTANVQDPVAPFNNTASAVSRDGAALIHQALRRVRDCCHSFATTIQHSTEGEFIPQTASSCLRDVIGGLFNRCAVAAGQGSTSELSEQWDQFVCTAITPWPLQASRDSQSHSFVYLLKQAQYAFMLSKQEPLATILLDSAAGILLECGPMSVGQLGRILQDACNGAISAAQIKSRYGGLKQLLLTRQHLFDLQDDHPFNPTCSLKL